MTIAVIESPGMPNTSAGIQALPSAAKVQAIALPGTGGDLPLEVTPGQEQSGPLFLTPSPKDLHHFRRLRRTDHTTLGLDNPRLFSGNGLQGVTKNPGVLQANGSQHGHARRQHIRENARGTAEHFVLERDRLVDRNVVLHLAAGTEDDARPNHDVLAENAARPQPRAGRDMAEMPDPGVPADRGAGIAAGDLPRVFDPYFTTKRGGTGLGLPIARNIVEGLGGVISITSQPGLGTEIRIELPIGAPPT